MSVIKLPSFTGEQPRIVPRLLPATAAQSALNARLDNGALAPYQQPSVTTSLVGSSLATIYLHNGTWLGFAGTVHAAPGPVDDARLYYTGAGKPKLRIDGTTTYDLELNGPTAAATATLGGSGSGDVQTRIYTYTFVTSLGEESEPAPASNEIDWQPGKTVTISGIQNAPGSPARGITKQRFYRSQTGTLGTDFYFIAERDVSASNFSDTVDPDAFAEPVPSRNWTPPAADLTGLIALPNGMMAAFSGKTLYFSEPYRPHAWPEIYALTTDIPIVALGANGTSVWVLTEKVPYLVTGSSPDAMVMQKVEANLPCVNARGVIDLGFGIAWPSADGLAVAKMDGTVGLATQSLFSPRDWQALNPGAMRGGQIAGRWIGSYDATTAEGQDISGSLIIDLSGQQSFLIRSLVQADAWYYDINSGFAYFLDADTNTVSLFDSVSAAPEQLYWRSKQFVLPAPDTMGAILVETGGSISPEAIAARDAEIAVVVAANAALLAAGSIGGDLGGSLLGEVTLAGDTLLPVPASIGTGATVGIYADGVKVATIGKLNVVARLPSGFMARIWELDVFSDIEIVQIVMARTTDELKRATGNG